MSAKGVGVKARGENETRWVGWGGELQGGSAAAAGRQQPAGWAWSVLLPSQRLLRCREAKRGPGKDHHITCKDQQTGLGSQPAWLCNQASSWLGPARCMLPQQPARWEGPLCSAGWLDVAVGRSRPVPGA